MCEIFDDEIVSIEYVGEVETVDVNVSGNRLFYADGILTHNCAVEETEFDHSHISGGLSKIQTADNVFGIFTSKAMRERGKYQVQLMKTRSSSGVGQKVELDFDVDTLRITDSGQAPTESFRAPTSSVVENLRRKTELIDTSTGEIHKVRAVSDSAKLRQFLTNSDPTA